MASNRKKKISPRKVLIWLVMVSVGLLCLPKSLTDRVSDLLGVAVAPFSYSTHHAALSVSRTVAQNVPRSVSGKAYDQLKQEHERNQRRLLNMAQELNQLREAYAQTSLVRQRLGWQRARLISAQVVARDSSSRCQRYTLNQGSLDQIQPGQLVVACAADRQGQEDTLDIYQMVLVGRIDHAGMWTSSLQLLSDPEFVLPVTLQPGAQREGNWQVRGFLGGKGVKPIEITMVQREYPVQSGDPVFAGLGHAELPVPVLVGWVDQVQPDDENPVMWHITLKPALPLTDLAEVVVVGAFGSSPGRATP